MKRHIQTAKYAFAAALMLAQPGFAQSTDALINRLVEKGVLTEAEAKELRKEAPSATAKASTGDTNEVRIFWRDGLTFESRDKKTFKGKIGGRLDFDIAGFAEDDEIEALVGDNRAGTEFRRARIAVEGEIGTALPTLYKAEFEFAGGQTALKDVFLALAQIPALGTFQIGHFKEPVGLDQLTSARFTPFLERAPALEAFAPDRNVGAMFQNAVLDQRATWAVGGFTETEDTAIGTFDGDWRITGRLTGLPWYANEGRQYVHVGVSGSRIENPNGEARFRSRPEAHLAPRYVDTGAFDASHSWLSGLEAALVFGPFSAQAEYLRTWVDRPGGADTAEFDGFYGMVSYFITGEHRPYRRTNGTFDRVKPHHNFGLSESAGPGAWEVLLRYSQLDLNDAGISGGRLEDVTAGVNWYLNPNWKVMFNYVFAHLNRTTGDGDAHIFETRFHVDF
jgi:phosphate-selective porin OprO and OprP